MSHSVLPRWGIALLLAVFTAAILAGAGVAGASGDQPAAKAPADSGVRELVSGPVVARDEHSLTERLANGRLRSVVSAEPLNFRTSGGVWKRIDTSLRAGDDGALEARAVDGSIELPAALDEPVALGHDGDELSVRLIGAEGERGKADGNEVQFNEVLPGVDALYAARAYGIKETLVLGADAKSGTFAYEVRGAAGWEASVEESGDVVVTDGAGGDELFRLRAPLAWDSAPDPAFTDALELGVEKAGRGEWRVTLTLDRQWLEDPRRVHPISVDPDVSWSNGTTTIQGAADCYLASNTQANYNFCDLGYFHTGYYNRSYKALTRFDLSSIPSNATVSSSKLKLFHPPTGPHLVAQHKLRTITSSWDAATVTWNKRNATTNWTTGGGDVTSSPSLISAATGVQNTAWYEWTAPTAAVQGWVDGTVANNGFQLATESGSPPTTAYTFISNEATNSGSYPATSAERPILEVTWSVPDTTPPALTLSGELATSQATWRTASGGDISLAATDAGTGVVRVEVTDGTTVLDSTTQTCSGGGCSLSDTFTLDLAALGNGIHTLTAAAIDAGSLRTEQTFTVRVDRGPPEVDLSGELVDDQATPIGDGSREVTVDATDAGAGVTALALKVDGTTVETASQSCSPGACSMQETWEVDTTGLSDGTHDVTAVATDGAGRTTTSDVAEIVKSSYPMPEAPPLSDTEITPFPDQIDFLYQGPEAVQTGLDPEDLDERRVAVVTGKVFNGEGVPAPGVTITVVGHPEYGETVSRDTGDFFLVVNGGEQLRLHYEVQGALPSEREVETVWNDYVLAEDVWLVGIDPAGTEVDFGTSVTDPQLAEGSTITDDDGTRTARVYVRPGTKAYKQYANGTQTPLTDGTIRVTEYTVGEGGADRMPASLPDSTAYTWAGEFQVDEAEEPGVDHVIFDKPVVTYLDNFLGTPIGTEIPWGDYNWTEGHWEGDPDGRVIKITDEVAGKAVIDVTGFGDANSQELDYYGIDDDELEMLADTYAPGKTLWRTEMPRFSTKDGNKAILIPIVDPVKGKPFPGSQDDCCNESGSIIGVQNQSLGEVAGLGGTPYSLRYDSGRTPGAAGGRSVRVPMTDETVSEDVERVEVTVLIAGQRMTYDEEEPEPNQFRTFYWDGKDAFDRPMIGGAVADVRVRHVLEAPYSFSNEMPAAAGPGGGDGGVRWIWVELPYFATGRTVSWGLRPAGNGLESLPGVNVIGVTPANQPVDRPALECNSDESYCWYPVDEEEDPRPMPAQRNLVGHSFDTRIDVPFHDARSSGVAGWGISAQHRYDTATGTLFTGDGERYSQDSVADVIDTFRGDIDSGAPSEVKEPGGRDIAVLSDGSVVRVDFQRRRIFRDWPDGSVTVFAGDPSAPFNSGDGGPAVDAGFWQPSSIAVGPDDTVYVGDFAAGVVRAISPDGTIRRLAGNGTWTSGTAKRDPLQVSVGQVADVAVAADGTVYISSAPGLYRLDPAGSMTLMVGSPGNDSKCGQEGEQCQIAAGWYGQIATAPDGTLYWTGSFGTNVIYLYRLAPGGAEAELLMTSGSQAELAVEGPIADSNVYPRDIEVDAQGQLLLIDDTTAHNDPGIWRLGADGRVRRIAYEGCQDAVDNRFLGDGGPARNACGTPYAISRGPDGLYIQERQDSDVYIRRMQPALGRYPVGNSLIASRDGSEVYEFTTAGRHIATLDAITERVVRTFSYDGEGRVSSINETDFGATTFDYATPGEVTVTGPDDQETVIETNEDGYASTITDAEGADQTYEYDPAKKGLLTGYTNQLGHETEFDWTVTGRLTNDTTPEGRDQTLARLEESGKTTVTHTTAGGEETVYETDDDGNGRAKTTITTADGAESVSQDAADNGTASTTEFADGSELTATEVADPRWAGAAAGIEATAKIDNERSISVSSSSEVVRESGDAPNDPFAFESLVDTYTVAGKTSTSVYDKDERLLTVTSPMGRSGEVEFDEDDRPVRLTQDGRADVTIAYDSRGRPTTVSQAGESSTITYGSDGHVATETDEEGGVTTYVRDGVGQVTSVTGPDDETTEFAYDDAGTVTSVTAPDGREFTFSYDDDGNVTGSEREARAGSSESALTSSIDYDTAGRPVDVTSSAGDELTIDYDAAGRATDVEADGGTSLATTYQTTGARDVASVVTDEGIESTFLYDGPLPAGLRTTGDIGPGSEIEIEYGYDSELRTNTETIGGDTITATYNDDEQVTAIGPVAVTYDLVTGDAQSFDVGETSQAATFDSRGLGASQVATADSGGGPQAVFADSVIRDGLGRITSRTETAGAASVTYSYAYDDAGRLTGISTPGGQTEGYGYDNTGGLISKGVGILAQAIPVDGHGRPTHDATSNPVTWSTDGEATSLPRPGGGQTALTYDGFGRIKTLTNGGTTSEYTYDGLGRRVALHTGGSLVRRYVYGAGLFPRARLDAAGDVLERYIYASQTHVPDVIVRRDGTRLRLITDSLGSVRVVINADTGAVVQRLSYTAFGQTTLDTNPGVQPFAYKGALTDPVAGAAGVVWMGLRAYSPDLGRFATPEPLGIAAAWNHHDAFAGDPINLIDPDGRFGSFIQMLKDAFPFRAPTRKEIGNGIAGAAHEATEGISTKIAEMLGGDDLVDESDPAFQVGALAGLANIKGAVKTAGKGIAKRCAGLFKKGGKSGIRDAYVDEVRGLAKKEAAMRKTGASSEEIARALHAARRALGEKYKSMTPGSELERIYARNLAEYGDRLGPSIERLRARGKSWDDIIDSAKRPGGKDLGY